MATEANRRKSTNDELRAAVAAAIEQWKRARQLPYLASARQALNQLIITGLRPVLAKARRSNDCDP